jgi:hypothetical protein
MVESKIRTCGTACDHYHSRSEKEGDCSYRHAWIMREGTPCRFKLPEPPLEHPVQSQSNYFPRT